ncbi:sugar transferase [Nocardioides ginsengisoli]|uniref:Sugar transferase n=1 Tax=Nocardioides ginsengisoli TaxID=363868 RepID=A0ABW3VWN8_9ACTN
MSAEWSYRLRDLVLTLVLLVVAVPLMLAIALLLLVTQGQPVLFVQERPGRYGRPFPLVKFRTMRPADPSSALSAPGDDDAQRITRIGRVLRASSLDELPELVSVLRGHMTLVGPRPLLPEYLDHYTGVQHLRHQIRPGLTGLAQVSGRNGLDWPDKLALDVAYVRRRSHRLDLLILLRTIGTVLDRRATSHAGHATMPRWDGRAGRQRT